MYSLLILYNNACNEFSIDVSLAIVFEPIQSREKTIPRTSFLSSTSFKIDFSLREAMNLPWWAEIRRTPSIEIALMSEWEEKIEQMAYRTIEEDVWILAGVPSWTMVLANRVLEISGKIST